jgi:hypothetical protein
MEKSNKKGGFKLAAVERSNKKHTGFRKSYTVVSWMASALGTSLRLISLW